MTPIKKPVGPFGKPAMLILLACAAAAQAVLIFRGGWFGVALPLVLLFLILFIAKTFARPVLAIVAYLIMGFLANGMARYIPQSPFAFGLLMDLLLLLGLLAALRQNARQRLAWRRLANTLVMVNSVWFVFTVLCVFNPESKSFAAWFYAMRGVALYVWISIPLIFLFFNRVRDLKLFLYIWGILSILAFIKGFMQIHVGPDRFEQAWLDGGGYLTHIIWGKLRAFSFYSDAGQFGAAMAHVATTAFLIMIKTARIRDRIFFGLVAFTGAYGVLLSGTRGALFIPLAGLLMYTLLIRNPGLSLVGVLIVLGVIVFFKMTYIGQSNDFIRRMRSAFNLQDASLQTRLENQRTLARYLAPRPLGGGVGSAGYWGQRFTPGTLLANTPTDSWYVRIWAEQGIIGLCLYLSILAIILIRGVTIIWTHVHNPELANIITALLCGCFGIFVASYGNSVFGQSPTGPIMQFSLAFIFLAPELDREYVTVSKTNATKTAALPPDRAGLQSSGPRLTKRMV